MENWGRGGGNDGGQDCLRFGKGGGVMDVLLRCDIPFGV